MPQATPETSSVTLDKLFRPALPTDSRAVVYTFAVAARVACAHPVVVDAIASRLEGVGRDLIPPESLAFGECTRLWRFFSRVALLPKPALRQEAGRALYRELDALSERLDMPSLPEWEKLPTELMASLAQANEGASVSPKKAGISLQETQEIARNSEKLAPGAVSAERTGRLFRNLHSAAREHLLEVLVGRGELTRSEVNLLVRYLAKEVTPLSSGHALTEALLRIGAFLSAEPTGL